MDTTSFYDEQQLLQQIAAGDEQAFRRVVHHYFPKLLGFVFKMTKTRHTAEELVQEVFVKLWQKREDEIQNLGGWLHTVASNLTINYLRRLARENRLYSEMKASTILYTESTKETIEFHESVALFEKALEKLPPQQKKVYIMTHKEGLSRDEIAEKLDVSPNTVKNHLLQATKEIRTFIQSVK